VVFEPAFAQGTLQVQAVPLRRVELVADSRQGELDLPDADAGERPGLDVVDARDGRETILFQGVDPSCAGCYFCAVATILLAGVDVFFRGKLEALLPEHHLTTADSVDPPELVICDISRIDPEDVADNYPEVPLLGFTNHTDTDGLRRAHTAGFDQVLAKSALDERLKEAVDGLLASVD
jgi:hypothetical protein